MNVELDDNELRVLRSALDSLIYEVEDHLFHERCKGDEADAEKDVADAKVLLTKLGRSESEARGE